MSSKTPAGVSSKLMGLKFMQRAKAKEDMKEKKEGQVKAQQEEKFVLEKKKKGCVVLEDDFVMHTSGRMSFMNYNPEVDALNAEHQERIKQIEVENAERNDVSEKEMAEVLGKRKHLSDSGDASGGQHPTDSKTEDRIPSTKPHKSPKTDGKQHRQETMERKGSARSQDSEQPWSKGNKRAQKHAEGKSKERPGKHKPWVTGSKPASLRAAAAGVS